MKKIACVLSLLLIGVASSAFANAFHPGPQPASAPEIDAGSAASALTLLAGTLLVIRGRRK
jgi:hypothetical protein